MIDRVVLLVRIAVRNLVASPINVLIGGLILLGTMIFVLLGGMLDSLNQAMQRSVVGSLAGHLQIYSAASKDELALFGQMGNFPDLPAINDFPKIQEALSKVENVKVVVPMGISAALITSGNIVDTTLEKLRNLYKARDGQVTDPKLAGVPKEELNQRIASEIAHVRQIIKVLRGDVDKAMKDMISAKSVEPRNIEALKRVEQEEFWAGFGQDPYANLEFLENRIAPIVTDTSLVFLRYVGTDLDKFQKSFDRMGIVKGTPVPQGQRGFLIADLMHEDQMKLKTARRLDKIKDALVNGRLIATDDELKRFIKENRHQTRELVLQLDGLKTAALVKTLQGTLGSKETTIDALLSELLDTTDANFDRRYKQFYELVVPQVQLYRVKVGDMRQMPLADASFDGVVSSYAIDHLNREGETKAFAEIRRVLKPGGEFLLIVINRDIWLQVAYPLAHHPYFGQSPLVERWKRRLDEAGFVRIEQGTPPGTLYILSRKPVATAAEWQENERSKMKTC